MAEPGDRVGAVSHSKDGTVYIFGYGTFVGRVKRSEVDDAPEPAGDIGKMVTEAGVSNPLIRLDSGKYVWGCECWWGPEAKVRERLAHADEVHEVDIDERRAEYSAQE